MLHKLCKFKFYGYHALITLANDEAVEKFKDPTKLELTCQGNPDGGYEAMVISMSGGTFSSFDSGTIFKGSGSNL